MALLKKALLAGLAGVLVMSLVSDATGGERWRGSCRRGDNLKIADLDMSPDPIVHGQPIRQWKVQIRLEGNRECETRIAIREGNDPVGREREYLLRPGMNDIEIQPVEGYRFRRKEHCFEVLVDLEGTRRRVDADRRFCARQRPGWSMREPDDRERSYR